MNLRQSLCVSTFFLFPDSGLDLFKDFDFTMIKFSWHDTENQQLKAIHNTTKCAPHLR